MCSLSDVIFPPQQTLWNEQLRNVIMQLNTEVNHAANSNDCKCTWLSWRFSAPGRGDDSSHTARLRTSFPLAPDWIRETQHKTENTPADPQPHQLSLNTPDNHHPLSQQNSICLCCGEDSKQRAICHTGEVEGFCLLLTSAARAHSLPSKYPNSKGQITQYWRLIHHQVKLKGCFDFWDCFPPSLLLAAA